MLIHVYMPADPTGALASITNTTREEILSNETFQLYGDHDELNYVAHVLVENGFGQPVRYVTDNGQHYMEVTTPRDMVAALIAKDRVLFAAMMCEVAQRDVL